MRTKSIVSGNIRAGVYIIEDNNLMFRRKGYCLHDCNKDLSKREFLLTSGVPKIGTIIEPNCPILEIQSWHPMIDVTTKQPNAWAESIIESVTRAIDLKVYKG